MTKSLDIRRLSRRVFLGSAAALAGVTALPLKPAEAASKYVRYNVMSAGGQKALNSFAKGILAMLKLPADHPQNWFRNAFTHLMDCPHGNWWFYVWHRAYLGFFERTIRELSGDETFAIPYWDWTTTPQIPNSMFQGVLTPTDMAYEPYTGNLEKFTAFIKPGLADYWKTLSPAQQKQLNLRGYTNFDLLWNDVIGYDPKLKAGISGNEAFATTCAARYLSLDNAKLDEKTSFDVSPPIVYSGLMPIDFYNPIAYLSFTSSKTPSHNSSPGGSDSFSILESYPHNKVHNYIGGVGRLDPGPYGYMTNFLSPVDPIFYLHHSNIDRLWDVWTRKQKSRGLPHLPSGNDLKTFSDEEFLFYVDGKGQYVTRAKAGDFLDIDVFQYSYEPGFGEKVVTPPPGAVAMTTPPLKLQGVVKNNVASVVVPSATVQRHFAEEIALPLMAQMTLERPTGAFPPREFDVLVNAPADVTSVSADSPYYAGTVAFFGPMMQGMPGMTPKVTVAIALPKTLHAFSAIKGTPNASLRIRLVPSNGSTGPSPKIESLSISIP